MPASVDLAPPFHRGVTTLMSVGEPTLAEMPGAGVIRRVAGIGSLLAAGAWGYAQSTGREQVARYSMYATIGLVAADVLFRLNPS